MGGLVVRKDHVAIGVVAGIRAVWSGDQSQHHGKRRRYVRASLADLTEHRITTVPAAAGRVKVRPPLTPSCQRKTTFPVGARVRHLRASTV